jgi:hypothetical protein
MWNERLSRGTRPYPWVTTPSTKADKVSLVHCYRYNAYAATNAIWVDEHFFAALKYRVYWRARFENFLRKIMSEFIVSRLHDFVSLHDILVNRAPPI